MSKSFLDVFTEFEKITGQIEDVQLLAQQGWTSEVRKVIAKNGTYLLKSSFKEKYQAWLKKEADILEALLDSELAVPKYYGYLEESHQNHLFMSFEQGGVLNNRSTGRSNREGRASTSSKLRSVFT